MWKENSAVPERALGTIEDRGKESTAIFSFIKGGIYYGNPA